MDLRKAALGAAGAALVLALWCLWLWQPERQLRLHQRHFLKACERRDWPAVARFVAADYGDPWGHDKEILVSRLQEAFGQFLFVSVVGESADASVAGNRGRVSGRLRLSGRGGPGAEMVMERANALREPFVFFWEKPAGRPWGWRLVRVEQPELRREDGLE